MTRWLAIEIGCLECGLASEVIGVFKTEAEAIAACDPNVFNNRSDIEHIVLELDVPV